MDVLINPHKLKHLVMSRREDLASASALIVVDDVSVWTDWLTGMFTVCLAIVYCLSSAFEVYPCIHH